MLLSLSEKTGSAALKLLDKDEINRTNDYSTTTTANGKPMRHISYRRKLMKWKVATQSRTRFEVPIQLVKSKSSDYQSTSPRS